MEGHEPKPLEWIDNDDAVDELLSNVLESLPQPEEADDEPPRGRGHPRRTAA